jgi:hypothetical protein
VAEAAKKKLSVVREIDISAEGANPKPKPKPKPKP